MEITPAKKRRPKRSYQNGLKVWLDKIFSGGLLLACLPLFIIVAVWIKLDSKGPVFFLQERVGKQGVPFKIIKFRTMRVDAPHQVATADLQHPNDYITRSGHFLRRSSLDELPQLVNVFCGQMSFIGPRPLITSEQQVLELRRQNGADQVVPGITGLAQVSGRDEVTGATKAHLDQCYAQNINFRQDFKILVRTALNVVLHRGVLEGGRGADRDSGSD